MLVEINYSVCVSGKQNGQLGIHCEHTRACACAQREAENFALSSGAESILQSQLSWSEGVWVLCLSGGLRGSPQMKITVDEVSC